MRKMKLLQGLFWGSATREMDARKEWTRKVDVLRPYYQHMDFSRAVISGSYALNQFTGDEKWEANDVDVLTTAINIDHFRSIVQDFCVKAGGEMVKLPKDRNPIRNEAYFSGTRLKNHDQRS